MNYDFRGNQDGWQDQQARASQNRFSLHAARAVNAESCLVSSASYDIADQLHEGNTARRDRVSGKAADGSSAPREISPRIKSAATGMSAFTSGARAASEIGGSGSRYSRPVEVFVVSAPPRTIPAGDWEDFNSTGDAVGGAMRRSAFFDRQFQSTASADVEERPVFRRPYSGSVPRRGAPAHLSVVTFDGQVIPLVKAPTGVVKYYSDFTLANWRWALVERQQVTESFGTEFLKVFGQRPNMIRFSGILIDTPDYNWKATFLRNWETTLRATRLVELNARIILVVEDIVAEGYFSSLDLSKAVSNEKIVPFQASFYARSVHLTDPNIVSSEIGSKLRFLREEAQQRADEQRRQNAVQRASSTGGQVNSLFERVNKVSGTQRDRVTRRRRSETPTEDIMAHQHSSAWAGSSITDAASRLTPSQEGVVGSNYPYSGARPGRYPDAVGSNDYDDYDRFHLRGGGESYEEYDVPTSNTSSSLGTDDTSTAYQAALYAQANDRETTQQPPPPVTSLHLSEEDADEVLESGGFL